MKTIKKIISVILLIAISLSLTGCNNKEISSSVPTQSSAYTSVDMSVACMTGPTGIGMVKLMADAETKTTANNYTFTVASAASDIMGKFISGDIKIASVPTNVAATLYNKTQGKVRILAVNTYGVLSILEKGNSIKEIADLKGKVIYSTGKGQNPEYILKYILSENGINPEKDVTINFVSSEDLVAKLISGEAEIAMAPEPAATTVMIKNPQLNRVLSINDEWSKVSDTQLMMGCVIALEGYINEHGEAVAKFLEEYEKSINFATKNIDEAAVYCAKYKITASDTIAKKAIPTSNLAYVTGQKMKTSVNAYLNVLANADITSIGGALPGDDFYYNTEK